MPHSEISVTLNKTHTMYQKQQLGVVCAPLLHICIFVYLHICIFVYLHICIFAYLHICIFVYLYICIFHISYFKLKFHITYFLYFYIKIFDVNIYIIYMFLYKIPKINLENHDFLKPVKTQNFEKIFPSAGTEKNK